MRRLSGRVALVTGGGRGIGLALVRRLAIDGASIVINDLDADQAQAAVDVATRLGAEAIACPGNVTADDFPDRFIATAFDRFGDAHIVVNNAGYIWNDKVQRISDDQWDAMQAVHLRAPFRILRALHPHLRVRIAAEKAAQLVVSRKIVNVSSIAGTRGAIGQAAYAAAKAGVIGLTRSLAKEWGPMNVNVNCVAFGLIETRLTQPIKAETSVTIEGRQHRVGLLPDYLEAVRETISLGRTGTPDEAAGGIMMFCLPESDYVTGQCLEVAGGLAY